MRTQTLSNLVKISPQVYLYERVSCPEEDGNTVNPPMNLHHLSKSSILLPQIRSEAFGDGSHPTTRLCAVAVDFLCRQTTPKSVLDVGTGTGVLARIARARGARFVVGTDIDPFALEASKRNIQLDSESAEILVLNSPPDHWGAVFDLVVANILEGPLLELCPKMASALIPGGILILSGFTRLQVHSLRSAYENHELTYISHSYLEEWALLMFRR